MEKMHIQSNDLRGFCHIKREKKKLYYSYTHI
jgi:hypothetical protein